MMRHTFRRVPSCRRGSILVVAIVLSSIFLVVAISLARISSSEIRSSSASDNSLVAIETAETGLEKALSLIYPSTSPLASVTPVKIKDEFQDALEHDDDSIESILCDQGIIEVGLKDNRMYRLSFFDRSDPPIQFEDCDDDLKGGSTFRETVSSVRSQGVYGNTVRAVEAKIAE